MKIEMFEESGCFVGEFEFPAVPRKGEEINLVRQSSREDFMGYREAIRTTYEVRSVSWGLHADEPDVFAEIHMQVLKLDEEVC